MNHIRVDDTNARRARPALAPVLLVAALLQLGPSRARMATTT